MRQTYLVPCLLALCAIGLIAAQPEEKSAPAADKAAAASALTPEQKAALAAIDVRLGGVEALAAKIDDLDYKAEVARQIADLKKRRLALEKNFDPALSETLMHAVISRYQVTALWLKSPQPIIPALPAIEKVEIGANRELRVNGKPFFPLSSWGQSGERFALLRRLAFNSFAGGKASELCDAAGKAGGYALPGFDAGLKNHGALLAYSPGDVLNKGSGNDLARQSAQAVVESYKKMRQEADSRPVLLNLTNSSMQPGDDRTSSERKAWCEAVVSEADIVSLDVSSSEPGNFDILTRLADGLRQVRECAGTKKPVFACIEVCRGNRSSSDGQPDVRPDEMRAAVWMAIFRGATGIVYFTHSSQPTFAEFAPDVNMQRELKRLNGQITRLAPAILADEPKEHVSITLPGGLTGELIAREHDGAVHLFAGNLDRLRQSGTATITVEGLKQGTKVEVIDEGRDIDAADGQFTDEFAPLAVHLYRIRK